MFQQYFLKTSILLYVIFCCCLFPVWTNGIWEESGQITGSLKYAFILVKDKQIITITEPLITVEMLKSNIILYYKPISNAYVYIYALIPGKDFILLNPVSFKEFDKYDYFYKSESIVFSDTKLLQSGEACWEIHLVVSTKRLFDVEKLIAGLSDVKPDMKNILTELTNKLNREILNLKVKKILGRHPLELPEPVNHPFRSNDDIIDWLDKNTIPLYFTDIYENIYFYECETEY